MWQSQKTDTRLAFLFWLGLVDEYHFYIHPTVLKGVSWFDQIDEKREFELLSAKVYDDNLVALYYKPKSE